MKGAIFLVVVLFSLASAEECPSKKDKCAQGYDVCVKAKNGTKTAHWICGFKYLGCKKWCQAKVKSVYYKCLVGRKGKDVCKKEAMEYSTQENCPKPNPCAKACGKGMMKCLWKTRGDKDTCKTEFVDCVKKCKCTTKVDEIPEEEEQDEM